MKELLNGLNKEQILTEFAERDGVRITIDIIGDVNYYSKVFLQLHNIKREYDNIFAIENYHDNRISIIVRKERENQAREFLEGFEHKSIDTENVKLLFANLIDTNNKIFGKIDNYYKDTDYEVEIYPIVNMEV